MVEGVRTAHRAIRAGQATYQQPCASLVQSQYRAPTFMQLRACFRRAVWRFVGDILAIVPTRDCTRLHERRRAERLTTAGSDGRAVAGCRDRGTASATECRGSDRRRRRCPNRGRSNTYGSASPSFRRASLGRVVRVKAYVVARHVGEVGGGQRATDPALQAVDAQVDERYGWCGVAQNR